MFGWRPNKRDKWLALTQLGDFPVGLYAWNYFGYYFTGLLTFPILYIFLLSTLFIETRNKMRALQRLIEYCDNAEFFPPGLHFFVSCIRDCFLLVAFFRPCYLFAHIFSSIDRDNELTISMLSFWYYRWIYCNTPSFLFLFIDLFLFFLS